MNHNPSKLESWKALKNHAKSLSSSSLNELFTQDPQRFTRFSCASENILMDFSKEKINQATLDGLIQLAKAQNLESWIQAMFCGEKINVTEDRAVLHTALRAKDKKSPHFDAINDVLKQMEKFSTDVLTGSWRGHTGRAITDVVNIGVGGSDLGAKMVLKALKAFHTSLNMHFLSNIDGHHVASTLEALNPETTLFIVVSKTFTTDETMTNANSVKQWLLERSFSSNTQKIIGQHFVAVSSESEEVKKFGILEENRFEIWDWVGGRYSLWSAVGLAITMGIGFSNYKKLLDGANQIDEHFQNSAFDENLPVLLALIGIWNHNFLNYQSMAVLPYAQNLNKFSAYLQQLDMESNGKGVDRNGDPICDYQTGTVIWGDVGTNGQHAFHQLLHQGTQTIPCEFIALANGHDAYPDHHKKLLANCLAQSQALAFGRTQNQAVEQLKEKGLSECKIKKLLPYKIFEGNTPSTTLVLERLDPENLGKLLAIYEHKVFVQGVIWNIFSFDQWGVELGKELASDILNDLNEVQNLANYDSSTKGLIEHCFKVGGKYE